MAPNQEPVRVTTQHHSVVVATALVTLLNQLSAIMDHAQVKKNIPKNFFVFKLRRDLEVSDKIGPHLSLLSFLCNIDDDGREDDDTKTDCIDTGTKCSRYATDTYCKSNAKVRVSCKSSCNLCCK